MADLELAARILACVESIPRGRVMTYGDVAEFAGANTPRLVGHVLSTDSEGGGHSAVPWQRVLRADGSFAPHLADEQRQLLAGEGVFLERGRVPLAKYRWD